MAKGALVNPAIQVAAVFDTGPRIENLTISAGAKPKPHVKNTANIKSDGAISNFPSINGSKTKAITKQQTR
jgi:hypothetical protein